MLQNISRYGLDKSGLKLRHEGGGEGNQIWPKNSNVFYGEPLSEVGMLVIWKFWNHILYKIVLAFSFLSRLSDVFSLFSIIILIGIFDNS